MEIRNVCSKISEDTVEIACAFSEYQIVLCWACVSSPTCSDLKAQIHL